MDLFTLTSEQVIKLHDKVLNPGELEGIGGGKSLDGALGRINFRISYGFIKDVYDLAAMYAVALAQGHIFNDANKCTAYAGMDFCLQIHGEHIPYDTKEVGDLIIKVAQGHIDEAELATWLRSKRIKALEQQLSERKT